jgi:mRNA interferase RelE/StbE
LGCKMYVIEISDKADKELNKLEKDDKERIIKALERIRIRPEHFLQRLVGSPYYRMRVGDYRLICDLKRQELVVVVIEVGHRERVYK